MLVDEGDKKSTMLVTDGAGARPAPLVELVRKMYTVLYV